MATLPRVHVAGIDELPPRILHAILKVRSDVFIVEQDCAYDDIDGRDAEPATRHLWIEDGGRVVSTLRVLEDDDRVHVIGRVATLRDWRHRGLSATLMRAAITLVGPPIAIRAQAYLADWYRGFGFAVSGEGWIEDGIPHVPMRLE